MNEDTFCEWMAKILPLLKPNSVIVIDITSYHWVKIDNVPPSCTRKMYIKVKFLTDKGDVIDIPMVISEFLHMVKHLKPQYERCVIDKLATANN